MPRYPTLQARIEALSIPEPNSGCWLWTGDCCNDGYGRTHICGRRDSIGAHRASYKAFKGPIPAGLCVLHRCDVRCCVNPDHLWLGTKRDNTLDMDAKGRRSRIASNGGVTYSKHQQRWKAQISLASQHYQLGSFRERAHAEAAYRIARAGV